MTNGVVIIGLTGGIGSGKSTVSQQLAAHGVLVLDADAVAHDLMARGWPAWRAVWEAFGWPVLEPMGEVDRVRLGRAGFGDPAARARLNALVHPAVRAAMRERTAAAAAAGVTRVVWDVPLLIEGGLHREVDQVWVVYATVEQQVERVVHRTHGTAAEARARVAAQWPLADKVAYADRVLDNTGSPEALARQVEVLVSEWHTS